MVILESMSVSSPSKSPTMEHVQQSHPHHQASVSVTQLASYSPKNQLHAQAQSHLTLPNETGNSLTTNASVGAEFSDDEANSFNNSLKNEEDKFFDSFPPGYRFNPFDEELVVHYLRKKVLDQPLPPNRIIEVNLYRHNPEKLAERYRKYGEKEWYFFTPRDRKYRNGTRPKRAAGDGYWKATGADKEVKSGADVVGYRKALVFYRGKPPKGDKTNWIMHEFRVKDSSIPRSRRGEHDMRLDNWVLCRIYKKADKNGKRYESRNHYEYPEAEIHSPPSQHHHMINGESTDIEMCTIVDPILEYDNRYTSNAYPILEYDNNKCSNKAYGIPNVWGVHPNNMLHSNRVQAVTVNADTHYANMGPSQAIGLRTPSKPVIPESFLGPGYTDESLLHEDTFYMKVFGNNYKDQFSSVENIFP